MEHRSFTWHGKFINTLEKIPESERGDFALRVIYYGTDGVEPNLEYPLDAIFESIREDVDNSVKSRVNGKKGAEARKNKGGKKPPEKPSQYPSEGGYVPIPNHTKPIKEKYKKENLGDEKTNVSPTKQSVIRCSHCGSEVRNRQIYIGGEPHWSYVCEQGHVCCPDGTAKNHPGGNHG